MAGFYKSSELKARIDIKDKQRVIIEFLLFDRLPETRS
jgi:hypothetical protein